MNLTNQRYLTGSQLSLSGLPILKPLRAALHTLLSAGVEALTPNTDINCLRLREYCILHQ